MAQTILSLYDVSAKLGVSPSAIKKRVASLNLPVERGARGKLLFNEEAYATLCRADELLKAGNGFEACRRELGLDGAPVTDLALELDDEAPAEAVEAPVAEGVVTDAEAVAEAVTALDAATEAEAVVAAAPVAEPASPDTETAQERVVPPAAPVSVGNHGGALPAPVFIQLGRRKPSDSVRMRMVEHQPTSTPMPGATHAAEPAVASEQPARAEAPAPAMVTESRGAMAAIDPDLMARLDAALKLIEDKDKHNHMLQSKLLVAYDEMTKLSATAAAFQERSMNLQHEVQKLQGEIRLLTAPPETKPWWKFWG
jgi:hypothetical protein